jgi:hydroxyacylglutathione hydrolase
MEPVAFFHGAHPGANAALLHGCRPVLVDSGFGSRTEALLVWLRRQGVAPARLALLVNTHHHSNHVGGNFLFHQLGVPIAAHAVGAVLVNARDPQACSAAWLRQPVPPYAVARPLDEGDSAARCGAAGMGGFGADAGGLAAALTAAVVVFPASQEMRTSPSPR